MTKYGSQRTSVDGIWFDSAAEAREYGRLKQLEDAGKIGDLRLQPEYHCTINGFKICTYRADFSYVERGKRITADVKGVQTPAFRLKRKLVEALHGVTIKLIPA